jgi:PAS domain S-box-containing protein
MMREALTTINQPLLIEILDHMDQGAILVNEQYQVVCFNQAATGMVQKVTGKQLLSGASVFSYCDQSLKEQLLTAHLVQKAGRSLTWQHSFLPETSVAYRYSMTPFTSATGFRGILIKLLDITDHVYMEEAVKKSNERYMLATRASYDMIWERDFNEDNYFFSEALMTSYGYDNHEQWSRENVMSKLVHPEDRQMIMDFVAQCYRQKKELFQCPVHRYLRADGSIVWVDVRCIAIYDAEGNNVRTIGITRDVSRHHLLEQELRYQTELLQTTNQDLERFTHLASHDLQEPLRMVASFLQLLQKKYGESLDDNARKYISFALSGAQRMQVRIMGLLNLSRAGSVERKEEVSMDTLMHDILQDLSVSIAEKKAEILITSPMPIVRYDRDQLQLVFMNLISNALKYTDGKQPRIELRCEDRHKHWQFSVKDNGIGIESRHFKKIFELFQRLHTQHEYEGTGVGLVIVKKMVEQGGGKVWVESSPPNGSCFYFTIPK